MASDKSFCSSYSLLSPEKAGVIDLLRILIYSDVHERGCVDSSEKGEESFERRLIMFVSILAQKLLLSVAKPLSWIGLAIEFWLNLLSSNRNFGRLLVNCFRGKVVMPDRESGSFTSIVDNLDKRVELDNRIRPGDDEYHAALSMTASKASYENENYLRTTVTHHWQVKRENLNRKQTLGMEFLGSYNFWNDYQRKATTKAFMLRDRDTIMVAFRGTEPFNVDDWCLDFDLSWYELPSAGKIHGGFMKALGLQKNLGWPKELGPHLKMPAPFAYYAIREKLSLGGALAILFPAILAIHGEKWLMDRLEGFMERVLKEHQIEYFRFVYGKDIVPRLPYDDSASMFTHFGRCCYFNSKYQGKILPEEPNKNFFLPLRVIPMMMNAWYELMRSFMIAYEKGPSYREGLLLRILRVIGLLVPGIPAHAPQDYVNSTRLGGSQLFLHQQ
ncbi:hypothetical protein BT93_L2641 [Corymbia citriodora subsp. variegata]|uniref:Fungal lipase-type domain-containing protein n=1 Tax=Corymbia citriodora subsp. variegata TaxID=360336 RepID=A0A8T0CZK9_CORYI|nr:hypothetical protein BT93_L2641 [Corymbia citriodora subsp. variegata]